MIGIIVFATCLFLVSIHACWRGGAPEKLVAVCLIAGFVATFLTPLQAGYHYTALNWPVLRVDLALLAALVAVALMADRFWPIWLAALQVVAIGTHAVRVYSPDIVPTAYWAISSRIAYPMLILLVAGTMRHRSRLLAGAPEFGWTAQRFRHESGPGGSGGASVTRSQ